MSRPSVNYDSQLTQPCHRFSYDKDGRLLSQTVDTGRVAGWRRLVKQASTSTAPRKAGNFSTPTAYFCSWGRGSCRPGEVYYRGAPISTSGYSVIPDDLVTSLSRDPSTLYVPSSWLWNELEIKALNKLRNSNLNLGVALAEAKETQHLIVSTATRTAKSISSLPGWTRAAARRYCGKVPSKVPKQYLEVMYGVNPLLADIQGAGEALVESQQAYGSEFQVRTRKLRRGSIKYNYSVDFADSAFSTIPYNADHRVQLRYILSCPILARLSQLGLVNPLEIIWERVPYSFVVDWLLPVGNWLSALSGDFGYTFKHGFKSIFCTFEERGLEATIANPLARFSADLRVTCDFGYFQRTLYSSSPVPGLYVKSPVSAHHIAEALSLLATSLRR